ncbi:SDR family oxidoreductase [Pelosinus sp. UFO1]|uniref:SDR family NAD(P)-dependent oxidoreductase n=1 Tax=Pelosinus sp. UFO1 TaxID=484770 RepID=UPI0004D16218|nr:SDR family oxidoreductase [Pelosinus sp. UFO1]AIF52952.1 short-chain dehydrogenase/reductase SDR [Pelosinus sp. UFO1]
MSKKVALVTGASSGIGREFARIHAAKGGDLVIIARRKDKLNELKQELEKKHNIKVKVIAKDLTLPKAPIEIYNEVKEAGIQVDYLINNAGFGGRGYFHERPMELDLQMIQVNIVTLTALTRLFLPDFVKRNSGKILNVSSTASLMAGPLQAVYYASKAYVTSFSNAIAQELHDTNITVTALLPGGTETEFAKTADLSNTPLFAKTVSPYVVAREGYDAMLKGKLDVIAGVTASQSVMLSMLSFIPKKVMLKQIYQMQQEK